MPAGVTFDASQGLLSGTPGAYTGAAYPLTFRADNGVGQAVTQGFTLTVDQPPAITSAASTVFVVGAAGSFLVNATGYPIASYGIAGGLPGGVTFDRQPGVLSGTPAAGSGGDYPLVITATNGVPADATQSFTLHVQEAPSFAAGETIATFFSGGANSFTIVDHGTPQPALTIAGRLPAGVSFDAATGVLSGSPPVGTKGTYSLTFTAGNGVGDDAVLAFTLSVVDSHGIDLAAVPDSASGAMDQFYWNSDAAGGGFTFTYRVTNPLGVAIPNALIRFDWATGPDVSDVIADAAAYQYWLDTPEKKTPGLHTITVTQDELNAGHRSPPVINGGLGTATDLLMRVDPTYSTEPFGTVQETDEANNMADLRVVPLVVDVLSHGFKPDPNESWSDFRGPWYDLASELAHVPAPDSTLDHRVAGYVTKWDSSTGFLNGIYALFASKVASAEAEIAPAEQAALEIAAASFRAVAAASAKGSDQILEQAARNVVDDLEAPGGDLLPPAQSNSLQHIELLGHSRGAALNAEVAHMLWRDGYRNMDYTALDGYSNDWPDYGGILTNIDIAHDTAMLSGRRLFYRVQEGLEHDPAIVNNSYISTLFGTQLATIQAENDLRSPDRTGSDPIVSPAGGYTISAHSTIEPIYASQPIYYEDDYVGEHRRDGLPTTSAPAEVAPEATLMRASPAASAMPSAELGDQALSASTVASSSPEYTAGFVDGDLRQLAALHLQIGADNSPTGDTAFDQFLQQIADPAFQIGIFWQTTGDVSLVTTGGANALQLSNTAGGADASISQSAVLPDRAKDIAFDLDVVSASSDSVLEISYAGSVIQSVPLAGISGSKHVVVPLPDGQPDNGQFNFLLTSASTAPATITLANFSMDAAANTSPTLSVAALTLPTIASGSDDAAVLGAQVSTLLVGITDPDPGAVAGIAVVAADAADGVAQHSLDGGTTWQNIGAVGDANALLLDGNPLTRLRFVPNPGIAGQLSDVLTIRAWDGTTGLSGIAGERFDITSTGGGSPFSSQTAAVGIDLAPTAHTPTVSNATTYENQQTTTGLVVTRNADDGAWAAYFQISGISGGRLFLNDGATPLADGDFITAAQGAAGLRFTPDSGLDTPGSFQVQASTTADGGGLGGRQATAQITIVPINHAPSFTVGRNLVLLSDSRALTIASWATNISPGPGANDVGQRLTFTLTDDDHALFSAQPTLDAVGNLRFTPNANASGLATVKVALNDDGGTAHGGGDTAIAQTFTISLVNLAQVQSVYVIGSGAARVPATEGLLASQGQLTVNAGNQTGAQGGAFALDTDGSFTYTPTDSFPGFDQARYVVGDAEGNLAAATVTVLSQPGGIIWKFYEQVLHRDPDYAGLQGWLDDLNGGGKPGDVALGFFESTELLNQIITEYYHQYLGRAPQGNDLPGWESVWRQTGGPEGIKAGFAASPEFNALAGNKTGANPAGWITALYQRILKRDPETGAIPFWEQQLASGVAEYQVALDFFTSLEAYKNDVTDWYYEYLGRAPSLAEQDQYAQQMTGGLTDRDIEEAITNLAEYSASPPMSPPGTGAPLPDYLPPSSRATNLASIAATDAVFANLAG